LGRWRREIAADLFGAGQFDHKAFKAAHIFAGKYSD
jgi:hypothetical protein